MAWNEPGSGKQRDPWKDGGGGPSPDLDALQKRIAAFFNRLFGGGGGGFAIAAFGILLAWLIFDSWVAVKAGHVGVVLRFGEFTRTMAPGFNLKWPRPIESVVDVDAIRSRPVSDQVRMLTKDENIVLIDYNVQYTVAEPRHYLFSVRDPDETVKQAAESAVREVIGANDLSSIMPDQQQAQAESLNAKGEPPPADPAAAPPAPEPPAANTSAVLAATAQKVLQQTLDRYDTGLTVSRLNFQNVRPPQEVKEAFDDAISAREDRQRRSNEAFAYAKSVVPNARGDAARIVAEAEGYKAERIAKAQGDAERFNLIESEYKSAPEVTRKRLYLETMQKVLTESRKVIDLSGGKNLLYLPVGANKDATPVEAVAPAVASPEPRGTH
ncbi:MAG TPA: FtsH protease activity modulator HflK [Rhodanobacteraceae bacterium]|jgi:membrane protease subunit HflK|nr:FtsH protease activity modulator HflK [Rhodanobacteraceae bacterium]